MIDTDKYEGHTPAPWEADLDDEGKRWIDAYDDEGDINLCRITNGNKADAQLIADAPLILEDYKRLREKIKTEHNLKLWEEAEVKRLREENDKLHAQRVQFSWIQEARGGQSDTLALLAEVKRLQKYEQEHKELWDIIANFSPTDSEEDNDTYQEWLESVSQGYMGSVYEYVMMKQEEMIE